MSFPGGRDSLMDCISYSIALAHKTGLQNWLTGCSGASHGTATSACPSQATRKNGVLVCPSLKLGDRGESLIGGRSAEAWTPRVFANVPSPVISSDCKMAFGKGTQTPVNLDIRDPAPAVYQLKSSKSNNTICLFTDFDSQSNESTNLLKSDTETFQSDQTTLDMRSMDSKSNGILFWKSRPDFACDNISDKSLFHSSSGIVCDAKLVEKSFETDMHLNFKNLSVIGFRILLLKVAGFNLLMTLRLWSR